MNLICQLSVVSCWGGLGFALYAIGMKSVLPAFGVWIGDFYG